MRPFKELDRFRCWVLTAIYAVLLLFAPLLIYATTNLWPLLDGMKVAAVVLITSSTLTALTSAKSLWTYLLILRHTNGVPRLAIGPFFFMLLSLAIASRLFSGL